MKYISFTMIIILAAVGCGKKTTWDKQQVPVDSTSITVTQNDLSMWAGVISKSEVTSYQYGTHQFKGASLSGNTEDMTTELTLALKSDKINLDDWCGKNVIITGSKIAGYPVENGPDFILVTAVEEDKTMSINESFVQDLCKMQWSAASFSGAKSENKEFGKEKAELSFSKEGTFFGKFCNTIKGSYTVKNDKIELIIVSKTKKMCTGIVMDAENFLENGVFNVDITKGILSLSNEKGIVISFTRATTASENPMAN